MEAQGTSLDLTVQLGELQDHRSPPARPPRSVTTTVALEKFLWASVSLSVKWVGGAHGSPRGLSSLKVGGSWSGLPERRPLQLRFNKTSVRLELIKTRLELSCVSDSQGLKPPRIHPSLFPVNNWAPMGSPAWASCLPSSLHGELDQERPGRKKTHDHKSGPGLQCCCTTPTWIFGGWGPGGPSTWLEGSGLQAGPHRAHMPGSLALIFPSFVQSTSFIKFPRTLRGDHHPPRHVPALRGPKGHYLYLFFSSWFVKEMRKC